MCGIAGMVGLSCDASLVERLISTMTPRGPDGNGTYSNGPCTLLHARLAIIDPEGGKQPMMLCLGQKTYIISYNGELYNTQEVRSLLHSLGHEFLTHSDTEVLLHAYAQWGEDCLGKLNGIYAFAVWEEHSQQLFLARDRMGVKPLFYAQHGDGLLFSSEIKTILAYPGYKAQLDATGVGELLLLGPGRTPGSGVLRGIHELEPGCCGRFSHGKLTVRRYWQLQDREHTDSFEETVETVRYLVMDAITRQMVADVPIGTFLSGGLDSSIISSICAKAMAEKGEQLHTFSIDYEHNDLYFRPNKFQPTADSDYIRIMEDSLHTNHHWTVLSADDLESALEAATVARDLPGMADVDFSLLLFCGKIRSHVKVALSGECADEIFGGYPWFRDPEVRAVDGFPWAQNTAYRATFLHPQLRSNIDAENFVRDRYNQTLRECDILPSVTAEDRRVKEMVNLNQRWFMQTLLDRKDRMSMFHGLEVRVPFCDHRIAEYLYGVPWAYKDHNGKEKGLLRTAMRGILPDQVLWRKKSPYPKTYDPHYLTLVSKRLQLLLEDKNAPIFQIVSADALQKLLSAEYIWPWYGQLMKLPQTIAYMLQIDYWMRHYRISVV